MIRSIRAFSLGLAFAAASISASHAQTAAEPEPDRNLRRPSALQPGARSVLSARKVLEIFRRNGITGILATSRPNKGTHQLDGRQGAGPVGRALHPALSHARGHPDLVQRPKASTILMLDEYKRGYYRGIGEFHIYGKSASSEVTKKIVNFAVEKDLYLHAHCDEEALLILFAHNPKARIIWAHTGFSTPPARVAGAVREISGTLGRVVVSQRHHRQMAAPSRRNGGICSRAIRIDF